MKVILTQDVKGQGKKDDIVNVSDGYARNFLFPKKLAVELDAKTLNEIENRKASQQHKIAVETENAKAIEAKLAEALICIKVAGSPDGRLYGSVTSSDISDAVKAQLGIELDKRKLKLDDAIKAYGKYEIPVKLYQGITGKINLVVTADK